MLSQDEIRERLRADLAWCLAVREHFLGNLASCDEGDWASLLRAEERISDLERALQRLDRGEYGICERCGAEIPEDRLEMLPECSLCVACAADMERARQPRLRLAAQVQ